ncbi:unnamed protein product [Leptidea sinapis]|uniref:Uncharacterized protein n=1 Tax=Leptidea sinapis TaxID=189913 RepID=A0A5E4Q4W0_9NEOP|nr:unnamed protein product [Leptidea sinapis]
MSKVKCNFCICPDSGILSERVCTKNNCYELDTQYFDAVQFTCEPLSYYEVDCNVCLCPRVGIKNIAKCTQNQCERNFLRSSDCTPSTLFTDVCNVCVCPPNGDTSDRACTKHQCSVAPLSIYEPPQSLLQNEAEDKKIRNLDLCFPGEEFTEGCKICVCPELGLKMYANCDDTQCKEQHSNNSTSNFESLMTDETIVEERVPHNRVRRYEVDHCMEFKIQTTTERKQCTPGAMYIVRCRQCICPYMGSINDFCRPLPAKMYCEQAYPNYNFVPMGRRLIAGNSTIDASIKTTNGSLPEEIVYEVPHEHTKYKCERVGNIMDECYICKCEESLLVIEEHCFKSSATKCVHAKPLFLYDNKVITQ